MKRYMITGIFITIALIVTSLGLAMSHEGKEQESLADLSTTISMEEAIKTATTQFPGKVLEAELEQEEGKAVYEIEIMNASGKIQEIEIDAQTGTMRQEREQENQDEPHKDAHQS